MTDPYAAFEALAAREHALAVARRWERLAAIAAERTQLLEQMPAVAPERARPHLQRAAALHERTTVLLQEAVGQLGAQVAALAGSGMPARRGDLAG